MATVVGDCQPSHCFGNASARLKRDPREFDVKRCEIGGFTLPFDQAIAGLLDRPAMQVDAEIDERAGDAEEEPVDVA